MTGLPTRRIHQLYQTNCCGRGRDRGRGHGRDQHRFHPYGNRKRGSNLHQNSYPIVLTEDNLILVYPTNYIDSNQWHKIPRIE